MRNSKQDPAPTQQAAALFSKAVHLHRQAQLADALTLYEQVVELNPRHFDAFNNLGAALAALGQLDAAVENYRRAIAIRPDFCEALSNLGNVLKDKGEYDAAIASYRQAIRIKPEHAEAHYNLGLALAEQQRWNEAAACYRQALMLNPDDIKAHNNLGVVLLQQGDIQAATTSLQRALALAPDYADALGNLRALQEQQRTTAARPSSTQRSDAMSQASNDPVSLTNLGDLLWAQSRLDKAIESYRKAIALKPDYVRAYMQLGELYKSQNTYLPAARLMRDLIAVSPHVAQAHYFLGVLLFDQGNLEAAAASLATAISLEPTNRRARWWRCIVLLCSAVFQANGADTSAQVDQILNELEALFANEPALAQGHTVVGIVQPFYVAYRATNNRKLLARYGALCARLMQHWQSTNGYRLIPAPRSERVKVGIVSYQVFNQSVYTALTKGWLHHLDSALVQVHVFYLGKRSDHETIEARTRCHAFIKGLASLEQWTEAILAAHLDVLVYPEIGMEPTTLKLASQRLAPVQVASWGHPESTGLPTIDYYLSAALLEGEHADAYYTEKLVRLPNLGSCYSMPDALPADIDLQTFGLSAARPLLLCPGNSYKYAPEYDWTLVELARRIEDAQFVFFFNTHQPYFSRQLRSRLRAAFKAAALDFRRHVFFVPWQQEPQFLGFMRKATVFLDTIGFSGFNTAMQAVAHDLPIVTVDGEFLRGKLASGILKRLGLHELVATSPERYVAIAERLVSDPAFNNAMRGKLAATKRMAFDDTRPVQALQEFLLSLRH